MTPEYEQPQRFCDHCEAYCYGNRCLWCKGPTRADDEDAIDYDRLREDRNERRESAADWLMRAGPIAKQLNEQSQGDAR